MKPLRVLPACLAVLALSATLHAAPLAAQAPDSPDLAEARKYTLTMDKVQKLVAAFDAVNKLTAANPALKAKMDADSGPNLNLDQRAKNIDANFPQVAAAIHAQGLTTREFIVVSIAFINDVSFVGMKKSGMIKAVSYTHLDVYKRQVLPFRHECGAGIRKAPQETRSPTHEENHS